MKVKEILEESSQRVTDLLLNRDHELRELSRSLYMYDYLDAEEIDHIMKGRKLDKEKVRYWKIDNTIM